MLLYFVVSFSFSFSVNGTASNSKKLSNNEKSNEPNQTEEYFSPSSNDVFSSVHLFFLAHCRNNASTHHIQKRREARSKKQEVRRK